MYVFSFLFPDLPVFIAEFLDSPSRVSASCRTTLFSQNPYKECNKDEDRSGCELIEAVPDEALCQRGRMETAVLPSDVQGFYLNKTFCPRYRNRVSNKKSTEGKIRQTGLETCDPFQIGP